MDRLNEIQRNLISVRFSGLWRHPMKRRSKTLIQFGTLILLLGLLLSSCAQPTAEVDEPSGGEEPAAGEVEEPAAPAEELSKIVVTWWSEPNNVDPHTFGTDGDSDARLQGYSTLITKKMEPGPYEATWVGLTGEYEPALAESWEFDEATSTVTFNLRDDVTFSSGNPLTAEDVRYTIERGFKSPTSYASSLLTLAGVNDPETDVEVIDEHTVVFNIEPGSSPLFFELMSELNMVILDQKTLDANATADDEWATEWTPQNLVGTGPYLLTGVVPGVEFVYEPNPDHYDAENNPKNGGIVIKVIPTAADRILLLKEGEVDVLRGVPYSEIDDLQAEDDIEVLTYPSIDIRAIALNNNIAPLDDVNVRRAISYAIPYDEILNSVWAGYATPLKSFIPDGTPTSDFSFFEYDYDPVKAKALLADAGYPDGFETTLFTRADNQDDQDIAVIVQDALSEIGVTVNIEKLLSAAYADRQFGQRDMPMFFFDWISYVNDPFYDVHWKVTCGQGTNYPNYCNPEIDSLYEEGLFETDPERRAEISKQIQKLFVEDAPWIFLSQPDSVVALRSDVHGWAEFPDRIARYWTLYKD